MTGTGRTVGMRNFCGALCGGIAGILAMRYVMPAALPLGVIIGGLLGFMHDMIWQGLVGGAARGIEIGRRLSVLSHGELGSETMAMRFKGRAYAAAWMATITFLILHLCAAVVLLRGESHPQEAPPMQDKQLPDVFGVFAGLALDGGILFAAVILALLAVIGVWAQATNLTERNKPELPVEAQFSVARLALQCFVIGIWSEACFIVAFVVLVLYMAGLGALLWAGVILPVIAFWGAVTCVRTALRTGGYFVCIAVTMIVTGAAGYLFHTRLTDPATLWTVAFGAGLSSAAAVGLTHRLLQGTVWLRELNARPEWSFDEIEYWISDSHRALRTFFDTKVGPRMAVLWPKFLA